MTLEQINKICYFNQNEANTVIHFELMKNSRFQKIKLTPLAEGIKKEIKIDKIWYDVTDYSSW